MYVEWCWEFAHRPEDGNDVSKEDPKLERHDSVRKDVCRDPYNPIRLHDREKKIPHFFGRLLNSIISHPTGNDKVERIVQRGKDKAVDDHLANYYPSRGLLLAIKNNTIKELLKVMNDGSTWRGEFNHAFFRSTENSKSGVRDSPDNKTHG